MSLSAGTLRTRSVRLRRSELRPASLVGSEEHAAGPSCRGLPLPRRDLTPSPEGRSTYTAPTHWVGVFRFPEGISVKTIRALALYVAAIVAANWLTSRYGMVSVFPGLTTTAGTYAAGFALLARDVVQDAAGRWGVLAAIAAGGTLTAVTSPSLAVASTAAFLIAETADWSVYTPLRVRGWARAVIASNIVGAVLDTLVFLWLASHTIPALHLHPVPGIGITARTVTGQLAGKLLWATLLPVLIVTAIRKWRRAVSRHAIGA